MKRLDCFYNYEINTYSFVWPKSPAGPSLNQNTIVVNYSSRLWYYVFLIYYEKIENWFSTDKTMVPYRALKLWFTIEKNYGSLSKTMKLWFTKDHGPILRIIKLRFAMENGRYYTKTKEVSKQL